MFFFHNFLLNSLIFVIVKYHYNLNSFPCKDQTKYIYTCIINTLGSRLVYQILVRMICYYYRAVLKNFVEGIISLHFKTYFVQSCAYQGVSRISALVKCNSYTSLLFVFVVKGIFFTFQIRSFLQLLNALAIFVQAIIFSVRANSI
jgi:hypothetical protein